LKYQNIYQYILHPDEQTLTIEEWKEFNSDCMDMIAINYRKLKMPREDLASNLYIVEETHCHLLEIINKKIHTYNPEKATFKTWMNGYIRNIVREFSNRYYPFNGDISFSALNKDSDIDIFDLLLSSPENEQPDQLLLFKEAQETLKVALEKLPSSQYKVLYYRCFKGFSVEKTAELMNTKKERISNILNKARERLKIHLEEMGWDVQNYRRKAN
jgi:RNA polymerase sigma factor (sigma-70 family)